MTFDYNFFYIFSEYFFINLFQANGAPAGQTVFHFHLHVLPRHQGDGLAFQWERREPGMQALQACAARLRTALSATDS